MTKWLCTIFSLILFLSMPYSAIAKNSKEKISTKQKIEFTTKDKFILVGDLYLAKPKTNKPLVVMLHSYGLSSRYWFDLPEQLRLKGYNVLAMDLRGHGRSVYNENLKLKSRYSFKQEAWQKLPDDVIQSINYVKTNYKGINCTEIYIIGADLGASAGVLAGANMRFQPEKMVLISPMLNFKGLYIPVKIASYKNTKFFVMLSKSDKVFFNFHTTAVPQIKTYQLGGQGNLLLRANKEANQDIINFLTK